MRESMHSAVRTYCGAVLTFLSDEWLAAMHDAVARSTGAANAIDDRRLVVQHVVTHVPTPGVDVDDSASIHYVVRLADGAGNVERGRDPDAQVTLTCDFPTAVAIATGAERAQSAFLAGRLTLGGDVRALLDQPDLVSALDDAAEAVRGRTDFSGREHRRA